ncbi:MAG: hypothetical protein KAR01_11885 [Desulfocapsa sp.]|nr:hypothetical protein [Desulfocapsa sp.]
MLWIEEIMHELKKSKVAVLSIVGLVMAVYLVAVAPYSIDKAQDIVIKKLSGLSALIEKDGFVRVDAGKKILTLSRKSDQSNMAVEIKQIATLMQETAARELKHPKLKGAGEKLDKAATVLLGEAVSMAAGESVNAGLLQEKGSALVSSGTGMIKKSERLMKMVSLRMYISSYWRGLEVFGGLFLFLIVYALYRKERWAFPAMVTVMALAPIGGFYISLAGAVFFKEPAGFMPFGIGLAAFWTVVAIGQNTIKNKIIYLLVFTLLGMVGTDAFSFAEHGIRGILAMPYAATTSDPAQAILRYGGPIALYTVIAVFIAIYKLAAKNPIGWWFAVQSGLGIMAVGFPIDSLRHKDSFMIFGLSLSTYLIGALLGLILVVLLFVPYIKNTLLPVAKEA